MKIWERSKLFCRSFQIQVSCQCTWEYYLARLLLAAIGKSSLQKLARFLLGALRKSLIVNDLRKDGCEAPRLRNPLGCNDLLLYFLCPVLILLRLPLGAPFSITGQFLWRHARERVGFVVLV